MLRRFLNDKRGNFAVVTGLAAIPLFGAAGLGLDYARGTSARITLQDRADEAVIALARQGPAGTDRTVFDHIKAGLASETGLTGIAVDGRWTGLNEATVEMSGKLPLTLSNVLPLSTRSFSISARSVARYKQAKLIYTPPEKTFLDPEAGDYNRVYAYCFNKDKKISDQVKKNAKSDNDKYGRSQSVAIADNAATTYTNPMPTCAAGETLSFQLFNSRGARGNPSNWDKASNENYSYYTDTEFSADANGVMSEKYNLGGWSILETVLCPSLESCKPKSQGGIIPEGKNRTPEHATGTCSPGKYMYYGWEDRPPGNGWTDQDYDDIRIIIACPKLETVGQDVVRLIK
ncbi:TadE/TadG family type IV pilus assembly protein [Aureimonas leprariae]|nr:TadE/TadG family type IV pilus assembly protein [Aureimonas leprariae]